jgi:putative sigma-54 modulation protein
MQLSTTFRHMDASQAVREYAAEKLDKMRKYFSKDPISAHATFAVERGFHHVADLNITLPSGIVISGPTTAFPRRTCVTIDARCASGRMIRDHSRTGPVDPGARDGHPPGRGRPSCRRAGRRGQGAGAARAPAHAFNVKDERFTARSMTVEDAVMQLNLLCDELLVFTDAGNGRTSVLYRRKDGNYGLIETAGATAGGTPGGR